MTPAERSEMADLREDLRMARILLEECKADFEYAVGVPWRSGMQFLAPSTLRRGNGRTETGDAGNR